MSDAPDAMGAIAPALAGPGAVNRAFAAALIATLAFVVTLAVAAAAVGHGIVADDTLRLWAGASTAADG